MKLLEASIPDWISAIGVLVSLPVAAWGLIKLFRKNREQEERQKYQASQIAELRKQTAQFEYQTVLLRESNTLLEKQLKLNYEIFTHSKDAEASQLELEKLKRKNAIRPYFIVNGFGTNADGTFHMNLINKGAKAFALKIESENPEKVYFSTPKEDSIIEKEEEYRITGGKSSDSATPIYQTPFSMKISFNDEDGHTYYAVINREPRMTPVIQHI